MRKTGSYRNKENSTSYVLLLSGALSFFCWGTVKSTIWKGQVSLLYGEPWYSKLLHYERGIKVTSSLWQNHSQFPTNI